MWRGVFAAVCIGGGEVYQSTTCSQSRDPALTLWITEQAAHEEHAQKVGHSAGSGPAVHFGWHTDTAVSYPHTKWHRVHHDCRTVSKHHTCMMKQVERITDHLWFACVFWSINPLLECWLLVTASTHTGMSAVFDPVLIIPNTHCCSSILGWLLLNWILMDWMLTSAHYDRFDCIHSDQVAKFNWPFVFLYCGFRTCHDSLLKETDYAIHDHQVRLSFPFLVYTVESLLLLTLFLSDRALSCTFSSFSLFFRPPSLCEYRCSLTGKYCQVNVSQFMHTLTHMSSIAQYWGYTGRGAGRNVSKESV